MHPFGERVEKRRVELGLTISETCRRAAIGRATYYNALERVPSAGNTVELLAFALEVEPEELLGDANLTPTPYSIALRRCADLLRPDCDGLAKEFEDAVNLLWRARFQGPGTTGGRDERAD